MMIQERYGKSILDDRDAPLRALFKGKIETFGVTCGKPLKNMVISTGIVEPAPLAGRGSKNKSHASRHIRPNGPSGLTLIVSTLFY